jgi:hypothetical protein
MSWIDRAHAQREKALRQRPAVDLVTQVNREQEARERREAAQRDHLEKIQRQAEAQALRFAEMEAVEGASERPQNGTLRDKKAAKQPVLGDPKKRKKRRKSRTRRNKQEMEAHREALKLLEEAEKAKRAANLLAEARLQLALGSMDPHDDDSSYGSCYFVTKSLLDQFERPEDGHAAIELWLSDDYPLLYKATGVFEKPQYDEEGNLVSRKSIGTSWIDPREIAAGEWD